MRVIENQETGETASEAHARRKAERLSLNPKPKRKAIQPFSAKRKEKLKEYTFPPKINTAF